MDSRPSLVQPTFVHLRTHSAYSLAEGALPIKQMAVLAIGNGMPAVAITDSGNLFGALEFSEALAEKGVQPIIGCGLRVAMQPVAKEAPVKNGSQADAKFPVLVLLAKSEAGYRNLMKLSSRAYLDTPETSTPHVHVDLLAELSEGLICLSGGPDGPLNEALVAGQSPLARSQAERLLALFGDRFYIELQRHNTAAERAAEPGLLELAYELGIPLVATNQVYFAKPDDYAAHDALLCIADGQVVAADDRRRVTSEHYFKSQQEMASLFADIPEAIANTVEIAQRCAFRVKGVKPILPRFGDGDEAEQLRTQAAEGLKRRLAITGLAEGHTQADYEERLDFELGVIIKMKYPGYFLIVADFIKWAKAQGYSGWAWPWFRCGFARCLFAHHYRSRSVALQAIVRTLPQP